MNYGIKWSRLCPAIAGAIACSLFAAPQRASAEHVPSQDDDGGQYLAGDFHNHTTCSDGETSVKTLTRKSLTYLDWFIQVGHSGSGPRDCRVDDFLYFSSASEFSPGLWVNTLENPATDIKGDYVSTTQDNGAEVQEMWKWQMLQEYALPSIVTERELPGNENKTALLGLEWTVPGHEHSSNAIVTGQYDASPRSDAIAQFEYCFGRPSDDTSGGGGQGWTCELSPENNQKLIALFANRPEEGTADYNSTLVGGVNIDDGGEHVKAAAAVLWTQQKFPGDGFGVQAHVERAGSFAPGGNNGWNVEHMRDMHGLAPEVAFGFESQPGHQAVGGRGGYGTNSAGQGTFGGTGCYAGAEASKPGLDFDGTPLDPARFLEGGDLAYVPDVTAPEQVQRVVICRPGVRTMWDALLSEGRRFWFFASSDWHSRGAFGPMDYEATTDFWPGEFQQNFTWIEPTPARDKGQRVVDGLRSGNNFTVMGQLIDKLEFKACSGRRCASMGEALEVRPGDEVEVTLEVHDPEGPNNSPYKFNNPSLLQIGVERPLHEPSLAQVDLIQGAVGSRIELPDPEYYNPIAPETTRLVKTWDERALSERGSRKRLGYRFTASTDGYVRARGSNIPAGTPNERDADGNPLADRLSDNIACADPACPPHVEGILDNDVEAWADLSFHTNPIFIEVTGRPRR